MSTFDFSALANTTTWSDSNFSQDLTNYSQGQVVSQTANSSLHCVCAPRGGSGVMRAKLTGRTWGTTIGSKITLNGIRGHAVTDDVTYLDIVIETGANAWKGYSLQIQNGFQSLFRLDNATDFNESTPPNTAIATSTSDTIAEGDTFELTLNTSTGVLIGNHNGTQLTTATDATYSTGLCAGFQVNSANLGGTGVSLFVSTGDTSGTNTTITPSAGSDTLTGNAPTAQMVTNNVIQTFTARRGGLVLEPNRRIVRPRRTIILPDWRRAA
jgi:hypothetical protein